MKKCPRPDLGNRRHYKIKIKDYEDYTLAAYKEEAILIFKPAFPKVKNLRKFIKVFDMGNQKSW